MTDEEIEAANAESGDGREWCGECDEYVLDDDFQSHVQCHAEYAGWPTISGRTPE